MRGSHVEMSAQHKTATPTIERRSVTGALSRENFHRALAQERARTDRTEHQFSVVLLHGNGLQRGRAAEDLIHKIANRIRVTDQIGWFDDRRIGLILPYTSSNGARKLVNGIRPLSTTSVSFFSIYTYPGPWLPEEAAASGSGPDTDRRAENGSAPRVYTEPPERLFQRRLPAWKRAMDIVLAGAALVVLSPLLAAVAMMIMLVSPGPPLLKQKRVGHQGRPFTIWKFRTMRVGVDTQVHRQHLKTLIAEDVPLTKLDVKGDPRIIPLGNFIRGCCLDELPQLINVLRGDMSLIGPRPSLAFEVSHYRPWQRMRSDTLPGMTGLWQVSGKNKTTFKEMMRLDVAYVQRLSLGLDVRIFLRTFPTVVSELVNALNRRRENRVSACGAARPFGLSLRLNAGPPRLKPNGMECSDAKRAENAVRSTD